MKIKEKMNPRYTQISLYVIATCVIIYVLSLVARNYSAAFKVVTGQIKWILKVLRPLVFAFVFAYLLDPLCDFWQVKLENLKFNRKRGKNCRNLAVLITVMIAVLTVVGIFSVLISSITKTFTLATIDEIIDLINNTRSVVNDLYRQAILKLQTLDIESDTVQRYVTALSGRLVSWAGNLGKGMLISLTNITGIFTTTIFTLIIGIYFLADGRGLIKYWKKVSEAFLSEKANKRMHTFFNDADTVFSGYIRGQLIDALFMMVVISVVLSIIGVRFAIVIGICAGIGNLIPYLGPVVAYGMTGVVCLVGGDFKKLIIGIIVLFLVQTLDGNLINPKLLSNSIQIHPLIVVVSLIVGSAVGGFLGMLLAVPCGALVKIMFNRVIENRIAKKQAKMLENEGDA